MTLDRGFKRKKARGWKANRDLLPRDIFTLLEARPAADSFWLLSHTGNDHHDQADSLA